MNITKLKIERGESTFRLRSNFKYTLITSLLIMACTAIYQFYPRENFSDEALFDQYYKDPALSTRAGCMETGCMFKAIALIKEEKYDLAIEKLEEIINERNFYSESAKWYQCLCLLKTNADNTVISDHLCIIITDKRKYSALALEILTKRYQYKQDQKPD